MGRGNKHEIYVAAFDDHSLQDRNLYGPLDARVSFQRLILLSKMTNKYDEAKFTRPSFIN